MAKQLVSPVERHLEKGVVGVCALMLLVVVAKYVVISPNQIEIGGEEVTPAEIDDKVAETAAVVRDAVRRKPPPEFDVTPRYPDFVANLDALQATGVPLELAAAVPPGPKVPIVDEAPVTTIDRTLVEVLPIEKLGVSHGLSTLLVSDLDRSRGPAPRKVAWVTVAGLFDVREQTRKQQIQYTPQYEDVIFGQFQLQRRARRPDGSWADEDWHQVTPVPREPLEAAPKVEFEFDNGQWMPTRDSRAAVDRFYNTLREPAKQLGLVRPLMWDVRDGDPWKFPVITAYRDVLLMDWEYLFPNDPPGDVLDDRYSETKQAEPEPVKAETPAEKARRLLKEAEQLLEAAKKSCSSDDATRAYNTAQDVQTMREAAQHDKLSAARLKQAANNLLADITRGSCQRQDGGQEQPGPKKRERVPLQQIWVHDAQPESLVPGRAYQYRMRPVIYNRLAGEPTKFANRDDAKVIFIEGAWSDPTEPIILAPDLYFFVTACDPKGEEISVELSKWFEGVWVRDRGKVRVGDVVSWWNRHDVPALEGSGVERPRINYDAGMVVADIDFKRPYRERDRAGRSGVTFNQPATDCAVVLVDAEGHLHERFLSTDKSHPGKGMIADKEFRAPKP